MFGGSLVLSTMIMHNNDIDRLKEKTKKPEKKKHFYKEGEPINVKKELKEERVYFEVDGIEYFMTNEQFKRNLKNHGLYPEGQS